MSSIPQYFRSVSASSQNTIAIVPPPPPIVMALFNIESPIQFSVYNDLPKYPNKLCPKYYLHKDVEEHISIFKDMCFRAKIQHEDVICRLFPYTLSNEVYQWYIKLPCNSIRSWKDM